MDINAIANQLIQAIKQSAQANLGFEDLKMRNFNEDVMNRGAARGTLYSTAGANQQSRYLGTTYLPKTTQIQQQAQQNELNVHSGVLDAQRKIQSLNRSANEINSISFDALLD